MNAGDSTEKHEAFAFYSTQGHENYDGNPPFDYLKRPWSHDAGIQFADGRMILESIKTADRGDFSGAKSRAQALGAEHGVTEIREFTVVPRSARAFGSFYRSPKQSRPSKDGSVCCGLPFDGEKSTAPISVSEETVATGILGSWVTTEAPGQGVFRASQNVVDQLRSGESTGFVIVKYEGSLLAVTIEEAYERHLRETTDGVEWHPTKSGMSAVMARAATVIAEEFGGMRP